MRFDTIIAGGNIIDGTGKREPFVADIGIQDDRIAAIGDLGEAETPRRISVAGQVVCPGFVDVHVHSEIALLGGRDQFAAVSQGVTTHLAAPDGFGWAPLPPEQAKELWHYTQFAYGDAELPLNWQTPAAFRPRISDRPAQVVRARVDQPADEHARRHRDRPPVRRLKMSHAVTLAVLANQICRTTTRRTAAGMTGGGGGPTRTTPRPRLTR